MGRMKCPCGSNKVYSQCCGRYIEGHELAPTPEALMRSRYSAFALGQREYLAKTMLQKIGPLDPSIQWIGLEIKRAEGAIVEFTATYRAAGKIGALHEVSFFEKKEGHWIYAGRIIE